MSQYVLNSVYQAAPTANAPDDVDMDNLVNTDEAAKALGVARRTLQRWASNGVITPDLVTPGGHYRWDVARLREELRSKRQRDE